MGRRAAPGRALSAGIGRARRPGTARARRANRPANRPANVAGFYGPGSEAWRLNREAVLLLGAGPRALLMQIAHPLVAEGVDHHSGFREDPWGRLSATIRSYLRIVYGTGEAARAEIARLNQLHGTVRGRVRDEVAARATGASRYRARDPALLLWVHATLIDSGFAAYDAWIEPLDRDTRARAYAETIPVGRALGITGRLLPPDLDAFEPYMARMLAPGSPIVVTPTARELARAILHPPLGPVVPTVTERLGPAAAAFLAPGLRRVLDRVPPGAYDWTLWPAVALLPPRLREEFGIGWGPGREAVAAWLATGVRGWRPILPRWLRWMPQALAADRRVRPVG